MRPARRLAVTGESMQPALRSGDRVVAVWWPAYRPGAVVAVRDPRVPERIVIKRVARIEEDGRLFVVGDNEGASTDSRHFGPVARGAVLGRVVYRYSPASTAGRVS